MAKTVTLRLASNVPGLVERVIASSGNALPVTLVQHDYVFETISVQNDAETWSRYKFSALARGKQHILLVLLSGRGRPVYQQWLAQLHDMASQLVLLVAHAELIPNPDRAALQDATLLNRCLLQIFLLSSQRASIRALTPEEYFEQLVLHFGKLKALPDLFFYRTSGASPIDPHTYPLKRALVNLSTVLTVESEQVETCACSATDTRRNNLDRE